MARIKTRPDELRDQLNQASAAATAAGPTWPASAPTPAALTAGATAINTDLTNVNTTEGTLATQRQTRDTDVGTAVSTQSEYTIAGLTSGPAGRVSPGTESSAARRRPARGRTGRRRSDSAIVARR